MDAIGHLQDLGDEILNIEAIYLSLKIEKALSGQDFLRDKELGAAEYLFKEITAEYHNFLGFLQSRNNFAA